MKKKIKKRLTVFVGAGAAIEIGGPSTARITKAVRRKKQVFIDKSTFFIDRVANVLDKQHDEPSNFEEIFHTLELISSYKTGWSGAHKLFTPYLTAFVKPRLTRFFKENEILLLAKQNLIESVAELVEKYDSQYAENNYHWHNQFWDSSNKQFNLDIATLNYDTCIEQCLPNLEDGFEPTKDAFQRFTPKNLQRSTRSKLFHLHGCINYGYAQTKDPNEFTLQDDFNDLYKFDSFRDARKTWFGRSGSTSQSSEEAYVGPIITGLRKTDKVISYPFSAYSTALSNSIVSNNALLIIGYSFGDIHLNRILERLVRIHGQKRRIVIITYFDGEAWHPDWTVMDWPKNREMMVFASKAFQHYKPFEHSSFSDPPDILCSQDGCARIYLKGFKDAAENQLDEIIEFLNS